MRDPLVDRALTQASICFAIVSAKAPSMAVIVRNRRRPSSARAVCEKGQCILRFEGALLNVHACKPNACCPAQRVGALQRKRSLDHLQVRCHARLVGGSRWHCERALRKLAQALRGSANEHAFANCPATLRQSRECPGSIPTRRDTRCARAALPRAARSRALPHCRIAHFVSCSRRFKLARCYELRSYGCEANGRVSHSRCRPFVFVQRLRRRCTSLCRITTSPAARHAS